ncbi:PAS domain S-box protein [Desulfohalovibrio reitneri]|uniref:PAS domain S-box protein n=1 Tax=Desulfohalovibrio reitneri TaxID=1307759 RepID=UPI0004A6BA12|nr:PAS domain S-box protein [Desulfohalovibrio reitneri]
MNLDAEESYRAFFLDSGAVAFLVDPDSGRIVRANRAACAFYGYSPPEFSGMTVFDLNTLPRDEVLARMSQVRAGGREILQFTHRLRSGELREVEVSSGPVSLGDQNLLYSIIRDRTEENRSRREVESFFTLPLNLLLVAGMDSRIHRVNEAWRGVLGYAPEDLHGRFFLDLVHPEDRNSTRAVLAGLSKGRVVSRFENHYQCGDGSYIRLAWSTAPDLDEGVIYATAQDVTESRRAEEELRLQSARLRALVELASMDEAEPKELADFILGQAMLLTDSGLGFVAEASADGERLVPLAFSPGAMRLSAAHMPRDGFSIAASGIWREPMETGNPLVANNYPDHSKRGQLPEGHAPINRLLAVPMRQGDEPPLVVAVANKRRDYTETDTNQLTLLMRGLWEHIRRRRTQAELLRAKEEAEAASEAKSRFLATVSHEMRTPLNGVLGMLQLLRSTGLSPEQDELAETAFTSGRTLQRVIGDILDFSSFDADSVEVYPESFDLAAMLRGLADIYQPVCRRKGLAFRLEKASGLPRWVHCDMHRLRQILSNLLDNAVKFSSDGEITLWASGRPAGGCLRLAFVVSDQGQGIPEDMVERVFNPFTQVDDSPTRSHQGVGLGLSIVSVLARALGGSVCLDSGPGGSSFGLSLPADKGSQPGHPKGEPSNGRFDGLRILLAEDHQANRATMSRLLRRMGAEVVEAAHGRQAVEAFGRQPVDLVLMDVRMPVMDGLDATRTIRAEPNGGDVPIAALTAHAMPGDRDRFLAMGMDGYLAKPLDLGELADLVAKLIPDRAGTAG